MFLVDIVTCIYMCPPTHILHIFRVNIKTNSPLVSENTSIIRGSGCSASGKNYERVVYDIVKICHINNNRFNTQSVTDLGGCGAHNDIECNLFGERDVAIEIKKANTPDWMQCSLKYDNVCKQWKGSMNNKIPDKSKHIFESLIRNTQLFNGRVPPFMNINMTHEEWMMLKKSTSDFNDYYMKCHNTTISNLYRQKGCYYIQISDKGLYHLGNDICMFGVPEFICEQQLRIRTKIHTKRNSKGFCKLSVTIACKPVNIKKMKSSNYSLDDVMRLPSILHILP